MSTSRAHLAYARQRARRNFGTARCGRCGQPDELTFNDFDGRVLCRRCLLLAQGLSPFEDDHPFGRRNHPQAYPMDANDHARLTTLQSYWPKGTQQNPSRSIVVKRAAGLRRLLDLLALEREHIDHLEKAILAEIQAAERSESKGHKTG